MIKSVLAAGALLAVVGIGATANPTTARAAEFGVTVAGNNGYVRVSTRSGERDLRRRRANRVIDQNRGARSGHRNYRSTARHRPSVVVNIAPRRVVRPYRRYAYAPVRRHHYVAPRIVYAAPRPVYIPRPVVVVRPAPIYRSVCLGRHEIRLSLRDRGWYDIHNFDHRNGLVVVTASNRYGTYRIRLDDCSGRIVHRRFVASLY